MIVCELFENREAYLYHATSPGSAIHILDRNEFEARTQHHINGKNYSGVSCTRNLFIAKAYSSIVFVLDRRKLAYRYKILPWDYWGRSIEPRITGIGRRRGTYAEAEEFVVGSITNAEQYIVAIRIIQKNLIAMKRNFPMYDEFYNHPLLVVEP